MNYLGLARELATKWTFLLFLLPLATFSSYLKKKLKIAKKKG